MSGPNTDTYKQAESAWDALPRRGEPPAIHGSAYTIDGIDYMVSFTYNGPATFCAITWRKKGRLIGVYGASYCNPKDDYNQNTGERVAFKKACGISNEWSFIKLRPLYDAWRRDQWEASKMHEAQELDEITEVDGLGEEVILDILTDDEDTNLPY